MKAGADDPMVARLERHLAEVRARARRAGRSRQALYELLAEILGIAAALQAYPAAYALIRERAGIKAQRRAPFTPILKLVFGEDYDRTRIAEYGTALAHAARRGFSPEQFLHELCSKPGGLKGLVQAERRQRRAATDAAASPTPTQPSGGTSRSEDRAGDGDLVLLLARITGNQNPRLELLDIIEDCPERIRQLMQKGGRAGQFS